MDIESSFELLQRAKAGDAPALERLLDRYRPRLHRWCSGRLPRYARDFTDTEDIVQEALLGLVRSFDSFDYRGEWSARPLAVALPDSAESPSLSPLEQAMGQQAFDRYTRALETLSAEEREAVIARVELGCSHAEVMQLVDKPSPDAARMFVARALERVARAMADDVRQPHDARVG
jgi:RNA polymerase sigma-70 factor (ECF subfamily)